VNTELQTSKSILQTMTPYYDIYHIRLRRLCAVYGSQCLLITYHHGQSFVHVDLRTLCVVSLSIRRYTTV